MSDPVLSREEIETLLPLEPAGSRPAAVRGAGQPNPATPATDRQGSAADVHSARLRHSLRVVHELLARHAQASLSSLLRTSVEVELTGLETLDFNRFAFSLENPTCFAFVKAQPLDEPWMLEATPAVVHQAIGRLLGGSRPSPPLHRPLTQIEARVARRFFSAFLDDAARAWHDAAELRPEIEAVECCPHAVHAQFPDVPIVLAGFRLALDGVRGGLHLGMPLTAVRQLSEKLDGESHAADQPAPSDGGPATEAASDFRPTLHEPEHVALRVNLAAVEITAQDLADLAPGDIIATSHRAGDPLVVLLDDQPALRAQAGHYQGRRAVQITGPIE